ncbi:hypothetical protein GCM10010123_03020 [Pilimelia anulata]|uniref:Uncharacterized protein n=1 Tax=Pilimelia anulata TaxID=53371 RepID=A0A8J3F7G4_9ACTN|nr:hypothetical protein GCM10010123_03020 [Pilimelia anulata]
MQVEVLGEGLRGLADDPVERGVERGRFGHAAPITGWSAGGPGPGGTRPTTRAATQGKPSRAAGRPRATG